MQLSGVLARDVQRDAIDLPVPDAKRYAGFRYQRAAITEIDRHLQQITDSEGNTWFYDKLVLAVGSTAFVPDIPGVDQTGVYTFRNLRDTDALYARLASARNVVVVGGGLLGLEAARALSRANTQVTVVQQNACLMNKQLDAKASGLLQQKIESLGIRVLTGSGVGKILGEQRVTGIVTREGARIDCDTVLFCTGIKPNVGLAMQSRLAFSRGIRVDDCLQTSDPLIYALGECCEHDGQTFGLVNPGYEQAAILADRLAGGEARYKGSLQTARLKVVGQPLASIGDTESLTAHSLTREWVYYNASKDCYRKLLVNKGRLIGAIGFGDWPELPRLQEAVKQQRRLFPWHHLLFYLTGNVWARESADDVQQWPASAIICQCNNIELSRLLTAMDDGATSLADLQQATGAGTVCGSCKPLLASLAGDNSRSEPDKAALPVLIASLFAMVIAALIVYLPGLQVSDTVQQPSLFENIWNDKFYKQVTGFSLLTLSALGLLMSLRKRSNWLSKGSYDYWRMFHVLLGLVCIAVLTLHTGLHMGANFNRLLAIDFIAVVALGACTGVVVAISHKLSLTMAKRMREWWGWLHLLVTWPLPVLLGIHILSVYYF